LTAKATTWKIPPNAYGANLSDDLVVSFASDLLSPFALRIRFVFNLSQPTRISVYPFVVSAHTRILVKTFAHGGQLFNLSKHRVLLAGILSPFLALALNVTAIQILLALSRDPESNWRLRLLVSSLVLPIPFIITLMLAWKDRRSAGFPLSAKIGLTIATLSLLLIAKPVMDGFARSKQSRNMAMHDVPAPMFDTQDIQGRRQRLSDYKGSVVLVNIWATWCEPCRYEMPMLDKLYQSRKANGFVVLGISDEPIETQQAFLKQVPVSYPLMTITPGVPNFYREIARYPAIFLIDRAGMLQPAPGQGQGFEKVELVVTGLLQEEQ
jgi:thiol-disulfide isomerase/thioredoxin